jgi:hypothetical protein
MSAHCPKRPCSTAQACLIVQTARWDAYAGSVESKLTARYGRRDFENLTPLLREDRQRDTRPRLRSFMAADPSVLPVGRDDGGRRAGAVSASRVEMEAYLAEQFQERCCFGTRYVCLASPELNEAREAHYNAAEVCRHNDLTIAMTISTVHPPSTPV